MSESRSRQEGMWGFCVIAVSAIAMTAFGSSPGVFPNPSLWWFILANLSVLTIGAFLVFKSKSAPLKLLVIVVLALSLIATYFYRIWLSNWYVGAAGESSQETFWTLDQADQFLALRVLGDLIVVLPVWLTWGLVRRNGKLWVLSSVVAVFVALVGELLYRAHIDTLVSGGADVVLRAGAAIAGVSVIAAIASGWLLENLAQRSDPGRGLYQVTGRS